LKKEDPGRGVGGVVRQLESERKKKNNNPIVRTSHTTVKGGEGKAKFVGDGLQRGRGASFRRGVSERGRESVNEKRTREQRGAITTSITIETQEGEKKNNED